LAVLTDDPLDGVEIFTDFTRDWDEDFAFLKGGSQSGEEFGFERGRELAEFDFAVLVGAGHHSRNSRAR
jgi:hypothetical protein